MQGRRRGAIVLTALGALAIPGAAAAATKTVGMGPAPKDALPRKLDADVNRFYPSQITVAAGDSVRFTPYGFHNVDFPKRGGKPAPFLTPAGKASGITDAAGVPFWFNGQNVFGFNMALLKGNFGKTVTYSPSKSVNSGLPLSDKPKPMTVKFPKAGKFTYLCAIHPGMKGSVTVKAKGAKAPSAKSDTARVAKQAKTDLATAKRLAASKSAPGTIGLGASNGLVEIFAMIPDKLTVKVGDAVTFAMPAKSSELHSAIVGPGNPMATKKDQLGYLGEIAKTFEGAPVFDPRGVYASDAPGAPSTVSKTVHGNGFWHSGLLDGSPLLPFKRSKKVTFTEAGAYDFYCVIHTFMKATVTVE